jgi:hypothetical protein
MHADLYKRAKGLDGIAKITPIKRFEFGSNFTGLASGEGVSSGCVFGGLHKRFQTWLFAIK